MGGWLIFFGGNACELLGSQRRFDEELEGRGHDDLWADKRTARLILRSVEPWRGTS